MDDLAEWAKPKPPKTGIDAERQEWIRKINRHLRTDDGLEVVLEAFDIQREWLQLHPGDMTMKGFGSSIVRSWTMRGGDYEDLKRRLRERYAQRLRKDAA